jgi:hypothetical protein
VPKQVGVALFVVCVCQVKPAQKGISGPLCRAHQITPAISFGLGEAKQLVRSPVRVAPNPSMHQPSKR